MKLQSMVMTLYTQLFYKITLSWVIKEINFGRFKIYLYYKICDILIETALYKLVNYLHPLTP